MKILRSLILVCLILFISSVAYASPLRIWVMPNEPARDISRFGPTQIKEYMDRLQKEDGIIIENTVQDLIQAGSIDNNLPIAGYMVGTNKLADEIREFRKETGFDGQISIKLIRWNDAFNALLAAKDNMPYEQMPDVIQIGSTWIASFAHINALENLDGLINEDDFYPASIESARPIDMDGLYAAPWFIDTRLMFYWKDKLPQSALKDWQSFKEACPKIIRNDPKLKGVIGFPMAMTWNLLHNLAPWLWSGGGDILEYRSMGPVPAHRVLLDDPKSIESILYLKDLAVNKCALLEDISPESMDTRFLNGEIASLITLPAFRNRLPEGWEEKIGIALPPAGPNGTYPFVGGSHLAIWFGAKKRGNFEDALSLVKHLTAPPSQQRYSKVVNFLPANKNALKNLEDAPYMDVYNEALLKGRSYPAIAEWGLIVENEFVRSHLWNIWQAIAQGQPEEIVVSTVKNASNVLRKKIMMVALDKGRWYALSIIGSIIGIGGLAVVRSRRKNSTLEMRLEKIGKELLDIEGDRTALQGQLLLLERREKKHTEQIFSLREKLKELGSKAHTLSNEIASIGEKRREATRPLLGEVKIRWNGRLLLDGNEVHFENANQAHHLIEHLARQMVNGVSTISCLWGYALFGWDAKKLHSMPNRLFNTVVAKINSAIAAHKRSAFLKSEGRKSWRWKCLWDANLFLKNCDITKALDCVSKGRDAINKGNANEASKCAREALELDPKCLEAFNLLPSLSQRARLELEKLQNELAEKIGFEIDELNNGVNSIGDIKEIGSEEYRELMEQEAIAMKHRASHLMRCMEGLDAKARQKPLHLTDILFRLSSIQTDISTLKAGGVAEKGVWATIVHDEKFLGLLSIPKIQSLVNRFYNHDTKMIEDPRLVQLALVMMLSQPDYLTPLEKAKSEEEFFGGFEKQLKLQFVELEQHISLLPPH